MKTWKRGDLCTVRGESDTAFRVIEANERSAYLERLDSIGVGLGHGREGLDKLTPLAITDIELVTLVRRRRKS